MFYRMVYSKLSDEMYIVHYYAMRYLIKKFGEQKLLKLIKTYFKGMKRKDFERNFRKIYGVSYNMYLKDFIDCLN